MLIGAHAIVYSTDGDADRAFFKDVLGFPYVDSGDGWLIFGLGENLGAECKLGIYQPRHASPPLRGARKTSRSRARSRKPSASRKGRGRSRRPAPRSAR